MQMQQAQLDPQQQLVVQLSQECHPIHPVHPTHTHLDHLMLLLLLVLFLLSSCRALTTWT
jgi:hypothetical protein